MGDFAFRVMSSLLSSEMLPASLRTKAMRAAGFRISERACIWAGANFRSKNVSIGDNVFINVGFYHDGYDMLEISNNVRIGPHVRVITATHEVGPPEQRGLVEVVGKPVRIGSGAWIGCGVTLLPGVIVESGCVIAASSVVYDPTESNGLYAGNPARRVRELDH